MTSSSSSSGTIILSQNDNNNIDNIIIAEEANVLIENLLQNFERKERAPSFANMRLFISIRQRIRRRLWPFIGERIINDVPSREYGAVVILGLDMPLPPSGPAFGECFDNHHHNDHNENENYYYYYYYYYCQNNNNNNDNNDNINNKNNNVCEIAGPQ